HTPLGDTQAGPLFPGGIYETVFSAPVGAKLSLATMFGQSNDLFLAPTGDGIPLYDMAGNQLTGDVTGQVLLWDAGTEANQEPGLGADQAPRQASPNTGAADANANVRQANDDFGNLPPVSDYLKVTLASAGPTSFRLRIENVGTYMTLATSDGNSHPAPLSPGVWVVHTAADPLFTAGSADRGEGLEHLAEDGDISALSAALGMRTGLTSPIAPGVYAVHDAPSVLFTAGSFDAGLGLEDLAEDGNPAALAGALGSDARVSEAGAFTTPNGASGPAPAFPGESYTFTVMAEPGDRLSLATMLVQSNDLFFAPSETGLDLFPGGTPLSGDVSGMFILWDAGTEVNEEPGVGFNQAPRQSGPNTGTDEGGRVRPVNDGYVYPDVPQVIKVTIQPVG
ncbi:MAG: spondin domain-containing protein, partial [Gemmatimonadota bacterium]|nr:spondin domain-containing protein [Gemmatimonadota bacterium]